MNTTILDWGPTDASESLMTISEKEVESYPIHELCPICQCKKKSIPAIEIGYPSWKTVVTLVQCSECSHIYYLNPPSQDAINQFYKSSWKSEAEDSKFDSSALPQMINEKLAYLMADLGINNPETSFFDVGCGHGGVMAGLHEHGFTNLQGCEIHPNRFVLAEKRFPNNVYMGGYDDMVLDQKFDIIYSNHVLEHVYNPGEMIAWKARHLHEDGLIIVNVPNAVFEPSIEQTLYLAHLHSFTSQSLQYLAQYLGLQCRFWKSPYQDELSAVFFRNPDIWKEANISNFYDVKTPERDINNAGLISRLQKPWTSSPSEKVAILTHSSGSVNIDIPFDCAGHWILFGWQAKFYEAISQMHWRIYDTKYTFPAQILKFLCRIILRQKKQLTGFGYMKIKNTVASNRVPRLSWKDKVAFIIQ